MSSIRLHLNPIVSRPEFTSSGSQYKSFKVFTVSPERVTETSVSGVDFRHHGCDQSDSSPPKRRSAFRDVDRPHGDNQRSNNAVPNDSTGTVDS